MNNSCHINAMTNIVLVNKRLPRFIYFEGISSDYMFIIITILNAKYVQKKNQKNTDGMHFLVLIFLHEFNLNFIFFKFGSYA